MNSDEYIEKLNEVAESIGGEIRSGYSGRGMYGARCYGIECVLNRPPCTASPERTMISVPDWTSS